MTDQNFETMRRAMVSNQLRTTAVNDPRVVDAMGAVAREKHVPADKLAIAYVDIALPLGNGRALNPPMVTGRLLTEARVRKGERVLVVGSATGYAAAILAELGAQVTALEEDAGLTALAAAADLAASVATVEGPLAEGWAAAGPYDLILIDGAVEAVPPALIAQLADGGRIATGLVDGGVTRLAIGRKEGAGFGLLPFADAEVVRLPGFAAPPGFRF
ncbi:protein-L-isoaspartate O-methyltransferase [Sphingomonas naphthae]|uniref:Protein-L-isoaspartate O-methyltransferase n=1 Tax=Sphingomonas naphthae TaxID=1813468 RepID=A0ABY7TJ06_9SPHN|nr:protein-L-isoaspartate O-methyltransferase [Sphingomonas naphthae]WCT73018.1 protein-L-isoaspartate O-methyltransferase [Sphingomonas naphthae]